MNKKQIVVIGTGETAHLAYEFFTHDSDFEVIAFAVEKEYLLKNDFLELPVIALEDLLEKYPPEKYEAFVALSSGRLNRDRTKMYQKIKSMGYHLASYVSSKAFVWHNVTIGENCFILEDNTL